MTKTHSAIMDVDQDESIVVLHEASTDSTVHVAPSIGSNIYGFRTELEGRSVEVLARPPDLATLRSLPTRWGSGVLFPYPGRVSNDSFRFRGEKVHLLPDPATGNAMHGIVRRRSWRVTGLGADDADGAWVETSLSTLENNIGAEEWPFPFTITLTIQLLNGRLRTRADISNDGEKAMPFVLGFHPYFPTPMGPRGTQDECEVSLPAQDCWMGLASPPAVIAAVEPDEWPCRQTPIEDIEISLETDRGPIRNHWFSLRREGPDEPRLLGSLNDPNNQIEVSIHASSGFTVAVFYTPPGLSTASIEPHTGMPNAFNLAVPGRPDPGLSVLEPGKSWSGWYEITATSATRSDQSRARTGLLS